MEEVQGICGEGGGRGGALDQAGGLGMGRVSLGFSAPTTEVLGGMRGAGGTKGKTDGVSIRHQAPHRSSASLGLVPKGSRDLGYPGTLQRSIHPLCLPLGVFLMFSRGGLECRFRLFILLYSAMGHAAPLCMRTG